MELNGMMDMNEFNEAMKMQAIQIGDCHYFDMLTESGIQEFIRWLKTTHPGNLNISLDPNPSDDPLDIMMGNMRRRSLISAMDKLLEAHRNHEEETLNNVKEILGIANFMAIAREFEELGYDITSEADLKKGIEYFKTADWKNNKKFKGVKSKEVQKHNSEALLNKYAKLTEYYLQNPGLTKEWKEIMSSEDH